MSENQNDVGAEFTPYPVDELPQMRHAGRAMAKQTLTAARGVELALANPKTWYVIATVTKSRRKDLSALQTVLRNRNERRGITGVELVIRTIGEESRLYCRYESIPTAGEKA